MWKVREPERIGVRTLWEVYRTDSNGETVVRGRWTYKTERRATMSAYSEWKNGQITDAEYSTLCRQEEYEAQWNEEEEFEDDEIDDW